MSSFSIFASEVQNQFDLMTTSDLYEVDLDKQEIWQLYLNSFPDGTNPIYKERTEHDCNCCKNFIRDVGGVVIITDGKLTSIWDCFDKTFIPDHYRTVAKALSEYVKTRSIKRIFSHHSNEAGMEVSHQQLEDGRVAVWEHFHCKVPKRFVKISPSILGEVESTVKVFNRGIHEITFDAITMVLDLIQSKTLYRGEEFKASLNAFLKLKNKYKTLEQPTDLFFWENYRQKGARIRNTVIGTLLQDLSENCDLEKAVRSYEQKVAPTNYKRPTALITKRMVEDAMKTIKELDIEPAFNRRFAVASDLSVNNVLYADRSTASVMKDHNLMSTLLKEVKVSTNYDKAEEITIEDFIKNIVPNTHTMELLLENKHASSLISLIAAQDESTPNIFQWDNMFSWGYRGNVTDSIKEKVKRAGGNVEADVRISLAWFNHDDLDLHVHEPKAHIFFGNKKSNSTSGFLDVDMNVTPTTREPVENVAWETKERFVDGLYRVYVHNYNRREHSNVGFEIEIEMEGQTQNLSYEKAVSHHENVAVLSFKVIKKEITEIKIEPHMLQSQREQNLWGIKTGHFHKVSLMTLSPNHWNESAVGNKHYIFILENCKNDECPRGFYNEFLKPELEKHRKVFEILGDKTKCEMTDQQLSGVGFSSTKTNSVITKANNKMYKILI